MIKGFINPEARNIYDNLKLVQNWNTEQIIVETS
jgi:hypothetical protein